MLPTSRATTPAFGFAFSLFIISARCFGATRFPFRRFTSESLMRFSFAILQTVLSLIFPCDFATAAGFGFCRSASAIFSRSSAENFFNRAGAMPDCLAMTRTVSWLAPPICLATAEQFGYRFSAFIILARFSAVIILRLKLFHLTLRDPCANQSNTTDPDNDNLRASIATLKAKAKQR